MSDSGITKYWFHLRCICCGEDFKQPYGMVPRAQVLTLVALFLNDHRHHEESELSVVTHLERGDIEVIQFEAVA